MLEAICSVVTEGFKLAKNPYSLIQVSAGLSDRAIKYVTISPLLEQIDTLAKLYESPNLVENYALQAAILPISIVTQSTITGTGHYLLNRFTKNEKNIRPFLKKRVSLEAKQIRNGAVIMPFSLVPTALIAQYFGLEAALLVGGATTGIAVGLFNTGSRQHIENRSFKDLFPKIRGEAYLKTMITYGNLPKSMQEGTKCIISAFS